MLKYKYAKVTFAEVPDEVSLCISISGCPLHCEGCHSPELWEDEGTALTYRELGKLIEENEFISCVCFMGGDQESNLIYGLAKFVKVNFQLKTCWYSGKAGLPAPLFLTVLDYIKVGPYVKALGGLESPTTNQRFYKITPEGYINITNTFYKKHV